MGGPYIVPLDLWDQFPEKSMFYLRRFVGEKQHVKMIAAFIGGLTKKILVDTGPPDMERTLKYHPYAEPEPLKHEQDIVLQLAKAGVKPEEIDIVLLTHLHWDHVGNVTLFPNAEFIVSQEELRFALNPVPAFYVAYEAFQLGTEPRFMTVIERIRTVAMKERRIVDGVKLIPLPGHTPGSMGVVVDTEKGPYVIAGDAAPMYGNLEGAPHEHLPHLMSGIYTDMQAMWDSFDTIHEIVQGDYRRVIPGHDPKVFRQERYPAKSR